MALPLLRETLEPLWTEGMILVLNSSVEESRADEFSKVSLILRSSSRLNFHRHWRSCSFPVFRCLTYLTRNNHLMSFGPLFLCVLFPDALTDNGSLAFSGYTCIYVCQKRACGIVGAHHFCPHARLLNPSDVHGCCA